VPVAITLIGSNDVRLVKDSRIYWSAIIFSSVFIICVEVWWNYCTFQREVQEYVFGVLRGDFQPVGVVECSTVDTNSTFKTLKSQK
jgi:hypothetical protein